LFERYLDALDQRFFTMLSDDARELLGLEKQKAPEESKATASTPGSESAPAPEAKPDAPDAPAAPAAEAKAETPAQRPARQVPQYAKQYVSHTRSTFNGRDYVEEHREKVTGADGETRIATRRRLGDRWYENEVHVDKDGKKTERETWHNVGDEDIEAFKLEWSEKQGVKAGEKPAAAPNPSGEALEGPEKPAATKE
jgi:hypothetical protein